MTRAALHQETQQLLAAADRQRAALQQALMPLQTRARRADALTRPLRARPRLVGFAAGVGLGLLLALNPGWPIRKLRALWRLRHFA